MTPAQSAGNRTDACDIPRLHENRHKDSLDVAPAVAPEEFESTAVQPPPMKLDDSSAGRADGAINLTAAFQNGANCIDECCADTGGPTAMEYGGDSAAEFADLIEFETGSHIASPLLSTPPRGRPETHPRQ